MTLPNLEKSRNMGLVGMYIPHRVVADNTEGGGVHMVLIGLIILSLAKLSVPSIYIVLPSSISSCSLSQIWEHEYVLQFGQ